MQKILLIGKNGQLGREIFKDAPNFNFEIIGVDKNEMDVTNRLQVKQITEKIKPDILINTAAYHNSRQCEENPMEAISVNFLAVQNLAKLCNDFGIFFITYSTDYVFDGEGGAPYEENDFPNPLQVYGASKLAGEYAALSLHKDGTFIIRPGGIFGGKEGSRSKGGNFVLNIMKEAREKDIVEVASDRIVSHIYAGDLSKATLKLLKIKASPGIYHLAHDDFCSWYELAKEIFQLAKIGKELKPVERGLWDGQMRRPRFSALKNTKAKALGIDFSSWQEGLRRYLGGELNLLARK